MLASAKSANVDSLQLECMVIDEKVQKQIRERNMSIVYVQNIKSSLVAVAAAHH